MATSASPGDASWRAPTSRSSYYTQRSQRQSQSRRPLPNPPNPPNNRSFLDVNANAASDYTAQPLPVLPLSLRHPPTPLHVPASHGNVFSDFFVGGFRRIVSTGRRTTAHTDLEAEATQHMQHAHTESVPFPTTPYPEQYYEYSARGHTATLRSVSEGAGERRTYATATDDVPEPSNMLLAVPGPSMHPSRSPSMIMSPQSIGPHPSLAPSIHHSVHQSVHHANALSVQIGQPSRSRTSSTGRMERHSSREPSETPVDGTDGEGDVATAVGHSDGAQLSIRHPQVTTPFPQPPSFVAGLETHGADEDKFPESQSQQPRSQYTSTFAIILAAFKHVCSLPLTAPVITHEWVAPETRTRRLAQSDSWYTRSARDGLYPGAPPDANVYPPPLPITATMSLSPGIIPPPNAFFAPWQASMQYYYPNHHEGYEASTLPPRSTVQQDYATTAPVPAMPTPSLLTRPQNLQAPSIHASTYRSLAPSIVQPTVYARAH